MHGFITYFMCSICFIPPVYSHHKSAGVFWYARFLLLNNVYNKNIITQIARFMGPTWGPPGSCRTQMGPMIAPWTLLLRYSDWKVMGEEAPWTTLIHHVFGSLYQWPMLTSSMESRLQLYTIDIWSHCRLWSNTGSHTRMLWSLLDSLSTYSDWLIDFI